MTATTYFQAAGRLLRVGGTIEARLKASVGELVDIYPQTGEPGTAEVIGFRDDWVQLMPLRSGMRLQKDDLVIASGERMRIPVGHQLLGRVMDGAGQPLDGRGTLGGVESIDVGAKVPPPMERTDIQEPFETGIRAIDGLMSMGRGQRVGLFAGSGVGKSTLLGNIARHAEAEINVVAMIGERGREVRPFIERCLGSEGLAKSVVIVSTSDETPLARVRASESAVAIATWFRRQGHNVLLMLDSLTRLATAQREIGLLLGEPPTSRGYTPSVFQKMASLLEQLGTSAEGSITSLVTVLVDGDDLNEPVADAARSILDGHLVLSRRLAERSHFPALDVSKSNSRVAHDVTSAEHRTAAAVVRRAIATYEDVEDLVQIGAYKRGVRPATDRIMDRLPQINAYLQQESGTRSSFSQAETALTELSLQLAEGEVR